MTPRRHETSRLKATTSGVRSMNGGEASGISRQARTTNYSVLSTSFCINHVHIVTHTHVRVLYTAGIYIIYAPEIMIRHDGRTRSILIIVVVIVIVVVVVVGAGMRIQDGKRASRLPLSCCQYTCVYVCMRACV